MSTPLITRVMPARPGWAPMTASVPLPIGGSGRASVDAAIAGAEGSR
jgi:hypothetical protein